MSSNNEHDAPMCAQANEPTSCPNSMLGHPSSVDRLLYSSKMSSNFESTAPMSAPANVPFLYFNPELELNSVGVSEETHEITSWREFRDKETWTMELLDLLGSATEDLDPHETFFSFEEFKRALKAGHDVRYIIRNSPKQRDQLMAILRKFVTRSTPQRRNPPKWMSRAKMHIPTVVGKAKDIYIMPRTVCTACCAKPTRYEQHTFLRWASHVCAHMYERCSRNEHVIANDAAYVLVRGRVMASDKETNRLLQQAGFHIMNTEALFDRDVQFGNVNYVNRWFTLGPICITSMQELMDIAWAFKGHNPLWKTAQIYVASARLPHDFDVDRFHAGLKQKILPKITGPRYQGGDLTVKEDQEVCSTPVHVVAPETKPRRRIALKLLEPLPESVDIADDVLEQLERGKLQEHNRQLEEMIRQMSDINMVTQYQGGVLSTGTEPGIIQRAGQDFSRGVVSFFQTEEFARYAMEVSRQFVVWSTMVSLLLEARTAGEAMKIVLLRVAADKPLYEALLEWSMLPQAGEDEHLSKVVVMSIFTTVKYCLGEVYESLIHSFREICAATKFAGLKEVGASIVQVAVNFLLEFLHRIKACVEQKSLQPLLGVDAVRWLRHTKGMMTYFDFIVGTPKPKDDEVFQRLRREDWLPGEMYNHLDTGYMLVLMKDHLDQASKLKHFFSGASHHEFLRAANELERYINNQHLIVESRHERIGPFCFEFFGPPGRGKSVFTKYILSHLLVRKGWKVEQIYTYLPQNFHTGLRADTKAVFFDDPDANPAKPTAGVMSHIQEIMRVGGNQTYEVEQADVADKGKVFAAPAVVGITTNFADLGAADFTKDPRAVWRRISWYITSEVKQDYALPGGMLNPYCNPPLEHSIFKVGRFKYDDMHMKKFEIEWVRENLSFRELLHFLAEKYDEWHLKQSELLGQATCEGCGVPEQICMCRYPQMQGAKFSGMPCRRLRGDAFVNMYNYLNTTSGIGVLSILSAGFLTLLIRGVQQLQGREAGVARDGWFRVQAFRDPTLPPIPKSTWSEDQLIEQVRQCFIKLRGECELYGVILKNGYILFPTHVWDRSGHCKGEHRGVEFKLTRDGQGVSVCHNAELTVAYVAALEACNGIWTYIVPSDFSASDLGSGKFVTEEKVLDLEKVKSGWLNGCSTWVYNPVTKDGDCGGLTVAQVPGGGIYVISMHIALQPVSWNGNTEGSHGVPITRDRLTQIMKRETFPVAVHQGVFLRDRPTAPPLEHYPQVSEVSVALTYYNASVLGWGTLPGNVGVTQKTKMKPTCYHDDVHRWAESQGLFHDFTVPEFRGQMIDKDGLRIWSSPWTYALEDGNTVPFRNTKSVQWYIDRCENFHCDVLTPIQAIQGVPGVVNSINMKTSCGPPNFGPKNQVIDREEGAVAPYLHNELEFINQCLKERKVPLAYGYCTLKDEILKSGKPARIFTNLTAAYNLVLKQYSHPFKQWAREFRILSCIWVGTDCGSAKISDLTELLTRYKYFYDGDIKKMDKSFSPELWDAVIDAIVGVTNKIAGDECGIRLRLLLLGLKNSIANIKGDLFTPFWNPSGNDMTVEINTVAMALIYVETFLSLGIPLEEISSMAIVGYGDDNVIATNKPLPPGVTQRFREISGMVLTDASKKAELEIKELGEVQFLKRTLRYDPDAKEWMAPLDEASLVKMLLYRGPTTLAAGDYDAELLGTAMRYALLQGRQGFRKWESFCMELAHKYHLDDNERLLRYNFDEFVVDYTKGTFSDWLPYDLRHGS